MKGVSFILEAVIACIVLFTAIIFFFKPIQTSESPEYGYKTLAYNSLKNLDETQKLRENVLDNNATKIKSDLAPYISYLSYDVVIYNGVSNVTAIPTITANDVISVSYFLAGDVGNYSAREVRVFVWGFD
jgi:hypothetical protein